MEEPQQQNSQDPQPAHIEVSSRERLVKLFARLNAARKVGEFSSCDHPQCLRDAGQAAALINDHGDTALIGFSADDGSLAVGDSRFEPNEPYLSDFALALRGAGIAGVRLAGGVTADGLVRFLRLMNASSEPGMNESSIRPLLEGTVAEGIQVDLVPGYQHPRLTPEEESAAPPEEVWKTEVQVLLGVKNAGDEETGDTTAEVLLAAIDPLHLAEYVNSLDFSDDVNVIASHFLMPYLDQTIPGQADGESFVPEQTRTRFLQLLRRLSPGHQISFLTAALEVSHSYTIFALTVLEAVPIYLAAQAFDGITSDENTVHPQITERFEALCRLTGWSATVAASAAEKKDGAANALDGSEGVTLSPDRADPAAGKHKPLPGQSPLSQSARSAIAATFSSSEKRKALIRVNLDLLERSTSLDETRAYSATLPLLFIESSEDEDWAGLSRDWNDLASLVQQRKTAKPYLGKALQRIRKRFLTIHAMELIVAAIEQSSPETRDTIKAWLPSLGSAAGESLVLALINANSRVQRRHLLSAIVAFGETAIPLALKRINDHRWYVVRNMIAIIREIGNRKSGEDLLPLSGHVQFQVRRELVNTLLALGHDQGLELAEKGIRGNDLKMRSACIGLLGSHRVADAAPLLLRILEDRFRGGVPFSQAQKVSAVWALGQIGARAVIPSLHRLLKKKKVFSNPDTHDLKMTILRSLPDYPLREVEPLIRWGVSHGDDDEAAGCRRLLEEVRKLSGENH